MVNTGHPSRACKLCRTRRIKCDETKPHCLKCRKAKRQCPGYRDDFEINLRDETQSTIRKAKKASAAARKGADQVDNKRWASPDDSPTKRTYPAAVHKKKTQNSPDTSEGSWESQSTWSSPSTDLASLGTQESPAAFFVTSSTTNFELTDPSSLQETLFDFNSTWDLPEAGLSSSLRRISKTISSTFDGTRLDFGISSGGPTDRVYAPALSLAGSLQTPLDEQATCYFLSNFVLSISRDQGPCLFNFILRILRWDDIKDTPFSMAFTAVSLAALASRPNSRHLFAKSRIYYSMALTQLKDAIKDKGRAKHDTSLASAILLSFYEALACENVKMAGWSNHLDGAKALLRLRGKDIVKNSSAVGLEMFQLVRSMSIRQHMFGFVANPIPGEVEWWGQHMVSDRTGHVALVLNMKTTLIRAEADRLLTESKTADRIGKALDLLHRAREIVLELGKWLDNCQPTWPKSISGFTDDVPEEALEKATSFPGPLYTFPNVWIAGKHLNTNASRIMLSGIMVRCVEWICAPSDHTATDDYKKAVAIGHEEVANVIASVPYFVTWSGDYATTPCFPCGLPTSPKGYSGVTALYPLLCTGLSCFATTQQKRWLCGRLRHMSETMGIKQADMFAQFISEACPDIACRA